MLSNFEEPVCGLCVVFMSMVSFSFNRWFNTAFGFYPQTLRNDGSLNNPIRTQQINRRETDFSPQEKLWQYPTTSKYC